MAVTSPREADAVDRAVGRRIAARRAALGRSQSALASELGISFQQLQKYEAGQNRVSASRLHHIALRQGNAGIGAADIGDEGEAWGDSWGQGHGKPRLRWPSLLAALGGITRRKAVRTGDLERPGPR